MIGLSCLFGLAAVSLAQNVGNESVAPAPEPQRTIELLPDPEQDAAIARRLDAIYDAISGLENVSVESSSGVVTLRGNVEGPRLRRTAEELAAVLEGVVAVENEIATAAEVDTRVRGVWTQVQARAAEWAQMLPLWVIAFGIIVASWYAGSGLGRVAVHSLRRARNPFVGELLRQAVRLATGLAGLVLALLILDAGPVIGSLIGSLGLIGLAIGFAVRDVIENYLASVLLSLRQPFKPDDLVSIDGREGRVLRLNSRATMLMDLDGNHLRIPNSIVYKATIVNFDRNAVRRFSIRIHVDPDESLSKVVSAARHALTETPGVLADPAPTVVPDAFGEASTELLCHAWIDQQRVDLAMARGAALISIQAAFTRAGIAMPVPRYAVSVTRAGTERIAPPAVGGPEAAGIDVGRADQTQPFRNSDEGENLLAKDGRTE